MWYSNVKGCFWKHCLTVGVVNYYNSLRFIYRNPNMTRLRGFLRAMLELNISNVDAISRAKSPHFRSGTDSSMLIAYSLPMVSQYGGAVCYN